MVASTLQRATKDNSTLPTSPRLAFHEKLLISSTKPLAPVSDLLNRLQDLHVELSRLDQEHIDTASLTRVTKDLASPALIAHKDKGVKSHVACCLADILRLYAPDAPYNEAEIRDIFDFFIRQLTNINSSEHPYHNYYYYLLESLSQVKSIVLIADLPNGEELVAEIFKNFFDRVSPTLSKNIKGHMTDILIQLTDECQNLPQEAFELIMAQFLRQRKIENPAAYRMAYEICNQAAEKLQRYVYQYFTDVIVAASTSNVPVTSEDDLREIQKAHDLIKELNSAAPELLLNVIPQLEEELQTDNLSLRLMATSVLGEMFANKSSNLASKYPHVFKTWIGRHKDKNTPVRIALVERVLPILSNHPQYARELSEVLILKVIDPEEKVRTAVCKSVGLLEFETALHLVDRNLLVAVGHRSRDKKHCPRVEAIKALARLFSLAYPEIVDEDALAVEKFNWIPSLLFNCLYTNEADVRVTLESVVDEYLFPFDNDDTRSGERLINVVSTLDHKARVAFRAYLSKSAAAMQMTVNYLDLCEKYNGGIVFEKDVDGNTIKARLDNICKQLSVGLLEPAKAFLHLTKFAQLHDPRCYKYLRQCMNSDADYVSVHKAANDAVKRIESSVAQLSETFIQIVRRISLRVVNKSVVPHLVRAIKRGHSNIFPALYRTHLPELNRMIQSDMDGDIVSGGLEAFAQYAKSFPKDIPQDKKSRERLIHCAVHGSGTVAKYAVIILAQREDGEDACSEIIKAIIPLDATSDKLFTHLSALAQLVLYQPQAFETRSDEIVAFIIKEIMLKTVDSNVIEQEEWLEFHQLPGLMKAKLMGLKVLVNRLRAFAEDEMARQLARPVFKMLWQILQCDGEVIPNLAANVKAHATFRAHLRIAAAISLLRLARWPVYEGSIGNRDFRLLAMVAQDTYYNVRFRFVSKLVKYLGAFSLHVRYLSALPLVAHDPESDIRDQVKSFLVRNARSKSLRKDSNSLFEDVLPRFLHLLAHHPDFTMNVDDLNIFSIYIEYYLECIAHSENVSYLYYIVAKLRTMRDADSDDLSENIYVLSDLAQLLIRKWSTSSGWTLPSYPGTVELPKELFKRLPGGAVAAEIFKKSYLPEEFVLARESAHGKWSS